MNATLPTLVVNNDAASLPLLIDRASARLAEARTAGEVLEARDMARAALDLARALAKVTEVANETQADCLRIINRAQGRLATEVDQAQQRGEVQRAGGDRRSATARAPRTTAAVTLSEIGVSRQRLSEWREVRDAGEDAVEEAINTALSEGRAPTQADIRRNVRRAIAAAFTQEDVDEEKGITSEGIEAANAANRRRVFIKCAVRSISEAEQGAGLRDARGPEIDSEVLQTLRRVIKAWNDLHVELMRRKRGAG